VPGLISVMPSAALRYGAVMLEPALTTRTSMPAAASVLWMLYLRRRNPRKLQLIGQIVFLDPDLTTPAPVPAGSGPAGEPPVAGGEVQPSPG
jgi:hypothetical protein